MSERDATALQPECNGVAPHVTRDETRNTFDEDRLTFGEAGSSSEAKRWHSTVRSASSCNSVMQAGVLLGHSKSSQIIYQKPLDQQLAYPISNGLYN